VSDFVRGFLKGLAIPPAWLLTWYFYGAGDLAYRILCRYDDRKWWVELWYPVYNENMILSADIQESVDQHGRWWPWGKPREVE